MKTIWITFAIALTLSLLPASAMSVTWTVVGGAFDDGGKLTGTYQFDANTTTFQDISLVTSGTRTNLGHTYNTLGFFSNNSTVMALSGTSVLLFVLTNSMTDNGGTIKIAAGFEGICRSALCDQLDATRMLVSGSVQTNPQEDMIPEPATWSLFASSFGILAMLRRNRRTR